MSIVLLNQQPIIWTNRPVVMADVTLTTPAVTLLGDVRISGSNYVQSFQLPDLADGFTWRVGNEGSTMSSALEGVNTDWVIGPSTGAQPRLRFEITDGTDVSPPIYRSLNYPPPVDGAKVEITGDLVLDGVWAVGQTITRSNPTLVSPLDASVSVVYEYYNEFLDLVATSTVAPWTVIPGEAEGYYVRGVYTASKTGYNTAKRVTPKLRVYPSAFPPDTMGQIFTPTTDEAQEAMNTALFNYKVDGGNAGNNEGVTVTGPAMRQTALGIIAAEAYSNSVRTFSSPAYTGTKNGRTRLIEFLKYFVQAGGNRAPTGRGAYQAQYESRFVAAMALARANNDIWNLSEASGGFNAAQRNALDLALKGLAIGNLYILSDANPYAVLGGNYERTVRGYKAQRGGAPNYSTAVRLIPYVVDAYLKVEGGSLQEYLSTWDRTTFAAQVGATGVLGNLWDTYRQDWTIALMQQVHPGAPTAWGPGPTEAELHTALRTGHTGGIYTGLGYTLEQGHDMFMVEFGRMFSKVVRPGPSTYKDGTLALPGRETGDAPWDTIGYGLKWPAPSASGITSSQLRGVLGSPNLDDTTDKSAWAGLPNPLAIGMLAELDTTDGGDGLNPPQNPNTRSEPVYAHHGCSALANCTLGGIVLGVIDKSDPVFIGAGGLRDRMRIGIEDFHYRTEHGHRGASKGGQEHPNRDWSRDFIDNDENGGYECFTSAWRIIDEWSTV